MSRIKPENGSDEYVNGDKVRNETVADITSLKATLFIAKNQSDFDYEKFFQTYSHMWASRATKLSNLFNECRCPCIMLFENECCCTTIPRIL